MRRLWLFVVLLVLFSVNLAMAGDYVGQYCVDLSSSVNTHRAFQLDIVKAGPVSYLINGLYINKLGEKTGAAVGSAIDVDSNIVMIINETHSESLTQKTVIYSINLAKDTFRGAYQAISNSLEGTSTASGKAQLISCEAPLTEFNSQNPTQDCTDKDGDGYACVSVFGTQLFVDCNDYDPNTYPGAVEICDDGIDNDCNGIADDGCNVTDVDGDGFFSIASGGTDCNDNNNYIKPGALEICGDNIDQNCNGQVDEGCLVAVDADKDGYASVASGGTDCNDNNPYMHPGALEICGDGIDEDCSGADKSCSSTSSNFVSKVSFGLMDQSNPPLTHHDRSGIRFTLGQQNYELTGNFNSAKTYASLVTAIKEELARIGLSAAVGVYLGESFSTYNDYGNLIYGTRIVLAAKNQRFSNFSFTIVPNTVGDYNVYGDWQIY